MQHSPVQFGITTPYQRHQVDNPLTGSPLNGIQPTVSGQQRLQSNSASEHRTPLAQANLGSMKIIDHDLYQPIINELEQNFFITELKEHAKIFLTHFGNLQSFSSKAIVIEDTQATPDSYDFLYTYAINHDRLVGHLDKAKAQLQQHEFPADLILAIHSSIFDTCFYGATAYRPLAKLEKEPHFLPNDPIIKASKQIQQLFKSASLPEDQAFTRLHLGEILAFKSWQEYSKAMPSCVETLAEAIESLEKASAYYINSQTAYDAKLSLQIADLYTQKAVFMLDNYLDRGYTGEQDFTKDALACLKAADHALDQFQKRHSSQINADVTCAILLKQIDNRLKSQAVKRVNHKSLHRLTLKQSQDVNQLYHQAESQLALCQSRPTQIRLQLGLAYLHAEISNRWPLLQKLPICGSTPKAFTFEQALLMHNETKQEAREYLAAMEQSQTKDNFFKAPLEDKRTLNSVLNLKLPHSRKELLEFGKSFFNREGYYEHNYHARPMELRHCLPANDRVSTIYTHIRARNSSPLAEPKVYENISWCF